MDNSVRPTLNLDPETGFYSISTTDLARALSPDPESAAQIVASLEERKEVNYFWDKYTLQAALPVPKDPNAERLFSAKPEIKGNQDRMCAGLYFPEENKAIIQVWAADLHLFTELVRGADKDNWVVQRMITRGDVMTDHFYTSGVWYEVVADFENKEAQIGRTSAWDPIIEAGNKIRAAAGDAVGAERPLSLVDLYEEYECHKILTETSYMMMVALHCLPSDEEHLGPASKRMQDYFAATANIFVSVHRGSQTNDSFAEEIGGHLIDTMGDGKDWQKVGKALLLNQGIGEVKDATVKLFKMHRTMGALKTLEAA